MMQLRLFLYPVFLLLALEFHHGASAHPRSTAPAAGSRAIGMAGKAPRELKRLPPDLTCLNETGTTAAGIGPISNR